VSLTLSPPRFKGPPLNALRAFEAAARLGGFSAAAEELSVTSGAIAQHIKAIEAWAGVSLFERRAQGVQLTDFGKRIIGDLTVAFDQLGDAVQMLRENASKKSLRIAALPAIAQIWLSPRLQMIRDVWNVETISVSAMEKRPNLRREPYDMSFFYVDNSEKSSFTLLEEDIIFPVCAPAVAAGIRSADDLNSENLLHDAGWHNDWKTWYAATTEGAVPVAQGPTFSLYDMALKEAISGAGILMGHEALVRRHIENGELAAPINKKLRLERSLMMDGSVAIKNSPTFSKLLSVLRSDASV